MTDSTFPVQPTDPRAARRPRTTPVRRYAIAAGAMAVALAVSVVLRPYLHPSYFFVMLGGVVVAAWYGGLGPGLLASVLGLVGGNYFLMEPFGAFGLRGWGDVVRLALFGALGYVTSALSETLRQAREEAEERAEEATRLAMQLQEQAVELEQQTEEAQALNVELEQQVEETERLRLDLVAANEQLRARERAAQAERERLRHILETMVEGVVLVDREGNVGYANPAGERILSTSSAGAAMELPIDRVFREGAAVHGREVVLGGGDGARRVLRVSAAPLLSPEGEADGAVISFDDATDRHRAEEALRESEERFRMLADAAPVLLWMAKPDGRRNFFNRPWLEFTGRMLEEELGDGWADGVHRHDRERCLDTFRSSLAARRAFRMEYRLRRADGEFRWLLETGIPRFTPDGSFEGYIGACIDINERHEAEEQQRFLTRAGDVLASSLEYKETLRRVCRLAVPVLADFCVIDLLVDGRIERVEAVSADPAQEALVGELRRFGPAGTIPAALATRETRVVNDLAAERVDESLADPAHRDVVSRLAVTAYAAVPLVAGGRVMGSILLCSAGSGRRFDPADVHRAEELARRAAYAIDNARLYERAVEANRAKRDFLAVMSHELRTPLNAILGYTDLFLAGIPAPLPEAVQPKMSRVQTAARHLLSLIEEILTFARLEGGQEEFRPEETTAATLAGEACALVEPLALEAGIAFDVQSPVPDVPLTTDPRKARQILVNLLGNAVKFTRAGEVSLRVKADDSAVRFHVRDTGIGIAPADRERIFEPFWQAEQGLVRERGGSGLGLSVARQLARLLGGEVTVESTPGEGSTFTLRLPR
ncbi:MAG TPA: ATP-binding protein [Longimicrobium sp.]|jgi:PAS domain S-box-containing protein